MQALTISEAARQLGVTPQRVHALLRTGGLAGPAKPAEGRAPRGAPRVYISSIEQRLASMLSDESARPRDDAATRVLRDDAQRLKIALDAARDQMARLRQQNARLTSLLAETVAALQQEQAMAEQADVIAEQYASIATSHLGPESLDH